MVVEFALFMYKTYLKSIIEVNCPDTEMVVHDISSQLIRVVAHTIREAVRFGLHQYGSGRYGGGAQENDLCFKFVSFLGQPVYNLYPGSLFGIGIVHYFMDNGVRTQGHVACGFGSGQGR